MGIAIVSVHTKITFRKVDLKFRKWAKYCFESAVSEERTH